MKKLILILLPLSAIGQPPWGSGPKPPDWIPPGQQQCWPPPCVSIGDYIFTALVITAFIIAMKKLRNK